MWPTPDVAYTERYCAFIDILGFRGMISESDRGNVPVSEIHRTLSAVHARPNSARPQDADLRHQSISDAVALSATATAAGLDAICTAAEELSSRLLRSGYFARGGISKGRLYHGENMVFGPALVEAYRLENEVAKFPRILVPRSIAADGVMYANEGTHWRKEFDGRFIQASDGPFYLHILRTFSRLARTNTSVVSILKAMRRMIQERFDQSGDTPDHFQKVAWFVSYWNSSIPSDLDGLEPITPRGP